MLIVPTSAFIRRLVVVGADGTLSQTLAIVTNGFRVVAHITVIHPRPVAGGTVSMATHTVLFPLAGKVATRTIVNTLILVQEVVLSTFCETEGEYVAIFPGCQIF